MSIAIELGFDAAMVGELRALSSELADSFGGEPVAQPSAEPHISLALLPAHSTPPVEVLIRSLPADSHFPVRFIQAAAFDSPEGVVYLAPERSAQLVSNHTALHRELRRRELSSNELYLPDRWLPHCTVLVGANPSIREAAMAAALRKAPPNARVTTIRSFDYEANRLLFERRLRAG